MALRHPTVDQLLQRARRIDSRIAKAAVYRALVRLVDAGLAFALEQHRGHFRYEDGTTGAHDHLINEATGEIVNVRNTELDTLLRRTAIEFGYNLTSHRMTLIGQPAYEWMDDGPSTGL